MMAFTLVIGSKRWSSWSLRPWLALKVAQIPFEEVLIPLRQPETKTRILDYAPSGKVPILLDGDIAVWESLAILDHLAGRFPDAALWPQDLAAGAFARSISAEMHAGFPDLRRELSMDVARSFPTPDLSAGAVADIDRIQAIWREARGRFGRSGPFLFGRFGNADAMYAPVVTRFQTYGVPMDPICSLYCEAIRRLPAMIEWVRAGVAEAS